MEGSRPPHFRSAAIATLGLIPILVAIFLVWKHAVALPFWDEWNTPGAQLASWYRGTLTFAELCSQHNESRKLVPRLIYLPLFSAIGWNARLALILVMATACLLSISLYYLAQRTIRSAAATGVAFVAMNLLLFSPREYENFLNPVQWETFLPGLALVLALLGNLSRQSLARKTVCNALLALVSTYTFANGMLLWLLAFPMASEADAQKSSKLSWRLAYIAAGAISIAAYFIGYQHPPLSPPTASLANDGPALIQFFLIWFGSLLKVPNPTVAGAIIVFLFLGLAGIAAWLMAKRDAWKAHYPWLVLGTYALISGAITAVARLGFTNAIATDAHYTVFTVLLYVAAIGLAFTVYDQVRDQKKFARLGAILGAVALFVVLTLWGSTFTAQRRLLKKFTEYRTHMLLVLRWAEAIPRNPELAWLSPYPEMPQTIATLAQHDLLRPPLVKKTLAQAVSAAPAELANDAGQLEQATPDGNGRLLVKGWARVPDENRPADCVVVGWETSAGWEPRWVLETGLERAAGAGFSRPLIANVPAGGATLRAWAIDLRSDRAYPLPGAIRVAP